VPGIVVVRNRKERRNRRASQEKAEASERERERKRGRNTRSGVGGRKRERVQDKERDKVSRESKKGEEKSKRGAPPGSSIGEEDRGPLTRSWSSARVGKWVYKRGPGDSISTHDPTFIPIANGPLQRA